ncbi:MAG TPA: sulfotransferase [Bacteroidia bacterium]|nr:sulfotransferase [Bacteroidia bacterium]HNT80734.1 sulfotransferase [Bacteroidia bacterium]
MSPAANKVNLFIVGAAKAGTTSIAHYLEQHPDVFISAIKEPHFFSKDDLQHDQFRSLLKQRLQSHRIDEVINGKLNKKLHRAYIRKKEDYDRLFENANGHKIIGEASTSYLWSNTAAKEIHQYNPQSKIIILLRNPIERAYSHYLMDRRMQYTSQAFEKALREDDQALSKGWGINSMYVELGMYSIQVKRYLDIFSVSQVKIILFDDLKKDSKKVLNEIYHFLDIGAYTVQQDHIKNVARIPRNFIANQLLRSVRLRKFIRESMLSKISPYFDRLIYTEKNLPGIPLNAQKDLSIRFKSDIENLSNLLNIDLSHWHKI